LTTPTLGPLVRLMDRLACATWRTLSDAVELGMDWGEVTTTHTNLLAIARQVRSTGLTLHIERITQSRERSLGADWEFWLQLATGEALGLSIQAKRIYLDGGVLNYSALGHPGERANEKQYDTLIRHARVQGSHPFHVFYNTSPLAGASVIFPGPWDQPLFGCAALSTYEVRRIRNTFMRKGVNRASRYAAKSMPWSDLFRVNGSSPGAPGGDDPAPTATTRLPPAELTRAGLERLSARLSDSGTSGATSLRDGLPDYIALEPTASAADLPNSPELPEFALIAKAH
jgi:hypothetical protein